MNTRTFLSDIFQTHHQELSSPLAQSTCQQRLIDSTSTLPTFVPTSQRKPLHGKASDKMFTIALNKRSAELICEGQILHNGHGSMITYATRYRTNPLLFGVVPLAFLYSIIAHGMNLYFDLSLPTLMTQNIWLFSILTVVLCLMFIYNVHSQMQSRLQEESEIRNWLQVVLEAHRVTEQTDIYV